MLRCQFFRSQYTECKQYQSRESKHAKSKGAKIAQTIYIKKKDKEESQGDGRDDNKAGTKKLSMNERAT